MDNNELALIGKKDMEEDSLISTKDLFHFTKSIDILKSIIDNGFYIQFSKEELVFSDNEKNELKNWAIPMICFCDIPFQIIQNHLDIYGGYGIGISKLYGNSAMKLNPVIYLDDSVLKFSFNQLFNYVIKENNAKKINMEVYDIMKYIKRYKGDYKINGVTYKNYKFYDEREWRYIPPFQITGNFIKEENFDQIDSENKKLIHKKVLISFNLEDVNYIIVKNKNEIDKIAKIVKAKYSEFDIKKINTIDGFLEKQ